MKDYLPDALFFDVEYIEGDNFKEFYNHIYDYRNINPEPYHYGSYEIYQADNSTMNY